MRKTRSQCQFKAVVSVRMGIQESVEKARQDRELLDFSHHVLTCQFDMGRMRNAPLPRDSGHVTNDSVT